MNSLDMPNTLSMYDTLSCGFVFVSLGIEEQERKDIQPPRPSVRHSNTRAQKGVPPAVDVQQRGRLPASEAS